MGFASYISLVDITRVRLLIVPSLGGEAEAGSQGGSFTYERVSC